MLDWMLVAAIATWRLTTLLLKEEGFLHVGRKWRTFTRRIPAIDPLGYCPKCLSVWVGAACAVLILTDLRVVLLPFAFSGVTMVINELLDRRTDS